MDLRDRCRGDGLVVECREFFLDRVAEIARDDGACFLARKGRQLVLQANEAFGHFGAEKIGTGREELPELDEARPQTLQRVGEPFATREIRLGNRCAFGLPAGQRARRQADRALEERRHRREVENEQRVVTGECAADRDQPQRMGDVADHARI